MEYQRQEQGRCNHGDAAGQRGTVLPARPVGRQPHGPAQRREQAGRPSRPLQQQQQPGQHQAQPRGQIPDRSRQR